MNMKGKKVGKTCSWFFTCVLLLILNYVEGYTNDVCKYDNYICYIGKEDLSVNKCHNGNNIIGFTVRPFFWSTTLHKNGWLWLTSPTCMIIIWSKMTFIHLTLLVRSRIYNRQLSLIDVYYAFISFSDRSGKCE